MTNIAFYSVLYYQPSWVLQEKIVVGLFFAFPELSMCKVVYPKNISRVKSVFPDSKADFIREGLFAREIIANKLTGALPDDCKSMDMFIRDSFGYEAISFVFGKCNPAIYSDVNELVNRNIELFFKPYNN